MIVSCIILLGREAGLKAKMKLGSETYLESYGIRKRWKIEEEKLLVIIKTTKD